jgi:hypothetical protein
LISAYLFCVVGRIMMRIYKTPFHTKKSKKTVLTNSCYILF